MVIAILLLLHSLHADTTLPGRELNGQIVNRDSGMLELSYARGSGVSVRNSKYSSVVLHKAEFLNFEWTASDAADADFSSSTLKSSSWSNSRLARATFRGADLTGAKFSGMTLSDCVFDDADLRGADLTGADLSNCTFARARYNDASQFPFDFPEAEAMGMIYVP